MKLAIMIVGIVILSMLDYLYIRRRYIFVNNKVEIKEVFPVGFKQVLCFVLIPITLCIIALMYNVFYGISMVVTIKRICVIAVLWPIAITDYQEFRIPNKLILYGLLLRMPILVIEIIFKTDIVLAVVINEFVAVVGSTIICIACMFLSRGSLGMGDLKLLMFMSVFLGVEGICYTMFVSLLFSAIGAMFLLIFKKKSKKDVIPFAPFILAGTFVSLFLTGV